MQTIYLTNNENVLTRMVMLPNLLRIKSRKKHVSEIYNHPWKISINVHWRRRTAQVPC